MEDVFKEEERYKWRIRGRGSLLNIHFPIGNAWIEIDRDGKERCLWNLWGMQPQSWDPLALEDEMYCSLSLSFTEFIALSICVCRAQISGFRIPSPKQGISPCWDSKEVKLHRCPYKDGGCHNFLKLHSRKPSLCPRGHRCCHLKI